MLTVRSCFCSISSVFWLAFRILQYHGKLTCLHGVAMLDDSESGLLKVCSLLDIL